MQMDREILIHPIHVSQQTATDREETTTVSEETEDLRETAREDCRAKETVREAALREITVRADVSAREDHRAKETVREAVHRVTDRAVRMETEAKDVTDVSAADRVVRDSVRIPERMMIWYLHRS